MPIGTIRTTMANDQTIEQAWHVVSCKDRILGRLAADIARVLQGKHKATYTPHVDTGDFVVVTDAELVTITGTNVWSQRRYGRYTHHVGGYKEESLGELFDRAPERVVEFAVRRMMPKTALGRKMFSKLKVYRGSAHPHGAQNPVEWKF